MKLFIDFSQPAPPESDAGRTHRSRLKTPLWQGRFVLFLTDKGDISTVNVDVPVGDRQWQFQRRRKIWIPVWWKQ